MGSGSSSQSGKYNPNYSSKENKENKAVQDDARSYRAKVGATKLILKNENIKDKFLKHLANENKSYVIEYYEQLDKLKKIPTASKDGIISNLSDILQENLVHETLSVLKDECYPCTDEKLKSITHTSFQPMKMLESQEVNLRNYMKMIGSCQENLLMLIIPQVEAFIISKEFIEAKKIAVKTSMRRKSSFKLPMQPLPKIQSSDSLQSSTSIDRMDTVDVLESIERTMNPNVAKHRPSLFQSFKGTVFPEAASSKSTFDTSAVDEGVNEHENDNSIPEISHRAKALGSV